ncbi:unnamed protein product [Zymoseptoria tritici ST99CH_3D7]|uniref:Uncharacterized protein n=1 Tax=Zymoseptoria tritici (strain ST99CH_3D7) TaxID=1276538 RepID=A0A1X7RQK8_ZYMT9|nr:unnamed protein product [Zymoseptoria tritici ST99CH_3D7]
MQARNALVEEAVSTLCTPRSTAFAVNSDLPLLIKRTETAELSRTCAGNLLCCIVDLVDQDARGNPSNTQEIGGLVAVHARPSERRSHV